MSFKAKQLPNVAPDMSYQVACLASDALCYKCLFTPQGWSNIVSDEYSEVCYDAGKWMNQQQQDQGTTHAIHKKTVTVLYMWADLRDSLSLEIAKKKLDVLLSCPVVDGLHAVDAMSAPYSGVSLEHVYLCMDVSCNSADLDGADSRGVQVAHELAQFVESVYPTLGGLSVSVHDHPCARLSLDDLVFVVDFCHAKTKDARFGFLGLVAFFDDLRYGNHEDAIEGVAQYQVRKGDHETWVAAQWDQWAAVAWDALKETDHAVRQANATRAGKLRSSAKSLAFLPCGWLSVVVLTVAIIAAIVMIVYSNVDELTMDRSGMETVLRLLSKELAKVVS